MLKLLTAKVYLCIAFAVLLSQIGVMQAFAQADVDYKIYCARCHGDEGHGNGSDAATLKTHPRDFTDCTTMAKIPDATMFKAIKESGAAVGLSADMPAWGSGLSDDQIYGLIQYIRNLCRK